MSRTFVKWPTAITIPVGQNASNVIPMSGLEGMTAFTLFAGVLTDAFTFTIELSYDDGGTYKTLNDGTADITAPAAGKCVAYPNPPATHMRIKSSSAATGAGDTWYMVAEVPIFS